MNKLSEFNNYAILVKKLYDRFLEPVCLRHDMTRMELDVLLFLANNPGFDTATDIIEQKHFTKSHVSSSVKQLEARGYLQGEFYPGNHKTIHMKILPEAKESVCDGQNAQKNFCSCVFQGISQEESFLMERIYGKINENIQKALKEEGS